MDNYLYLSLYPESLIASMLEPEGFGNYLAIGTKKRASKQEAIFFQVDLELCSKVFYLSDLEKVCVPHEDGEPKHTEYYSIYRVLEKIPLNAIRSLFLVTKHGMVMEIKKSLSFPEFNQKSFLYQEIVPVHPRIISSLNPVEFIQFITNPNNRLYVPKICFVDLRLGALSDNPESGSIQNLPYPQIDYLKECIKQVKDNPNKHTKTVNRIQNQTFLYRIINHGFFIGSGTDVLYYPFPSEKELNNEYFDWWKSATY